MIIRNYTSNDHHKHLTEVSFISSNLQSMFFRQMLGTMMKTGTNGNAKGAAQKSLSSWSSSSGLRVFDHATILENIKPSKELNDVVERALDKLSKEEVDMPRLKNLNILDKEVFQLEA